MQWQDAPSNSVDTPHVTRAQALATSVMKARAAARPSAPSPIPLAMPPAASPAPHSERTPDIVIEVSPASSQQASLQVGNWCTMLRQPDTHSRRSKLTIVASCATSSYRKLLNTGYCKRTCQSSCMPDTHAGAEAVQVGRQADRQQAEAAAAAAAAGPQRRQPGRRHTREPCPQQDHAAQVSHPPRRRPRQVRPQTHSSAVSLHWWWTTNADGRLR